MKNIISFLFITSLIFPTTKTDDTMSIENFHDFTLSGIDGTPVDFSNFKGKKVLLINVASRCGYTPQYKDLQALHEKHGDEVVLLGFPANNFGGQEPGSNDDIASFCKKNYGVSFQMFEKISVKGNDQHPLYQWLASKTGEEPSWNFCKYLVDENGENISFYPSSVNPMGEKLLSAINAK